MPFNPDNLLDTLQKLPVPTGYLVGYSGGLDSHVLLDALVSIQDLLTAPVRAIHTDHGLQSASAAWAVHCHSVCAAYGIPLVETSLNLLPVKGESMEAVARDARYQAIASVMEPGEMMLTAHHQDDQAETLLLQLMRGAGLSGLAAMPSFNKFADGTHARPLLVYNRSELEVYASARGLQWIEDGSNQDRSFDRNYLRHEVMPLLRKRWPAIAKTVSRSARHCAEADYLLEDLLGQQLVTLLDPADNTLSIDRLLNFPTHHIGPLLRAWIKGSKYNVPDTFVLNRIVNEVLFARPDRNPLVGWSGAEVRRFRNRLYLMLPLATFDSGLSLAWRGEPTLDLPAGLGTVEFRLSDSTSGIDLTPSQQYKIRFRQAGDWCRPLGRGVKKSVKQLLQEYAVLPWVRDRVPVLEIAGEIAAVVGLCDCEPLKKAPELKNLSIQWHAPFIWQQQPFITTEQ
ncbi:MAG: tRNA lysidine(34) synthetase TilS [Sedimenticola sp.]|nr:tRNA lysidine(34) synthetase TilS [Sedimenticola sp.]